MVYCSGKALCQVLNCPQVMNANIVGTWLYQGRMNNEKIISGCFFEKSLPAQSLRG